MPQLVTVKPKEGSRKFTIRGNMTQYNKIDGNMNTTEVRSTGEYRGQRFPNSRQFIRVKWSYSKRRWLLAGASKNSERLNEIVKACKLKYEDDHKRAGDYIETADLFDMDDPFFTHSKLKMVAREGEFVLDKDYPKDKILIMAIQAQHEFEVNGIRNTGAHSSRVKYVITDKNIDNKTKVNARNKELEAIELYRSLDDDKKIKIAIAMGFVSNDNADIDTVDQMLYEAAKNTSIRKGSTVTVQDYFIGLVNASTDEINIRYLIHKARGAGYLKKVRNQGWMMFGQPIGRTDRDVYDYFKNGDNSDMIIRLEETMTKDSTDFTEHVPFRVKDELLDEAAPDVEKTKRKPKKDDGKTE